MGKIDKTDFFHRVYDVVEKIPYGKVTTYGAIAEYLGLRSSARLVGWALNQSIGRDNERLPCHRVVNRLGQLTGKVWFGGNIMKERLEAEGIRFVDEDTVDMDQHFWDPRKTMLNRG